MIKESIKDVESILNITEEEARKKVKNIPEELDTTILDAIKFGWLECRTRELINRLTDTSFGDYEQKQTILDLLTYTLRHTRAGNDIREMKLDGDFVKVFFQNDTEPSRVINVAMDSGIAMIRDVMKYIDIG